MGWVSGVGNGVGLVGHGTSNGGKKESRLLYHVKVYII